MMQRKKMQKMLIAVSFAILLVFQVLAPGFQGLTPLLATSGNPCLEETSGFSGRIFNDQRVTKDTYSLGTVLESVYQDIPQRSQMSLLAGPVEMERNIISNVVLKDEEGNIIDADENPGNTPSLGDVVHICMDWSLENNHGYGAGSTFTFTLPEQFEVYNDVEGSLISGNFNMGSFTLSKDTKVVVMTFNEQITEYSNVGGRMWFETTIREEIEGSIDQEIIFEIKDEQVAKILVQFEPPAGSEIDKRGAGNRAFNATEITWTVDFNKQLKNIENAILSDPINNDLELKSGSVKVYRLHVQLDGTVVRDEEEVPAAEYTLTEDPFTIEFGNITDAYRVEYVTEIINDEGTTYSNTATLSGDNISNLTAGATVTTSRGTPLAKRSRHYNVSTQTITWEIKYNHDEREIAKADAKLVDVFTDEHDLIPASFKVEQITIDASGKETVSDVLKEGEHYTITRSTQGFTLRFEDDIQHAYVITYQTTANDRIIDNSYVTNEVTAGDDDHKASFKQEIWQQVLFKSYLNLDYRTKTVDWVIEINRDAEEMKNLVVTDTFPNKGLTLDESSFKITNMATGVPLEEGVGKDYTLVNQHPNGFEVNFLKPIDKAHHITYTTKFSYDDLNGTRFVNDVSISWVDSSNRNQHKSASAGFEPDLYTKNNGFKSGSYHASNKVITWEMGINYDLKTLTNIHVTDAIQDIQSFIDGSIKVYEAVLTGEANGITSSGTPLSVGMADGEYTFHVVDNGGEKEIQITIHGTTSKAYWIEFQTHLKEELIVKRYDNVAEFTSDGRAGTTRLPAHVTIMHGGSYVDKFGIQNNKVIDWTIHINFGQSHISNASLLDEPDANQILLEDSFTLFSTTVDADGKVSKDSPLLRDEDYTVTIHTAHDGSQTFELAFTSAYIDQPYILEYQSYINAGNGEEITNHVTFNGEQITTETVESGSTVIIRSTSGGGTGSGELGRLEVLKVDDETGEPLKGAVFTLYDGEERYAIRTVETDKDGKAIFDRLLYDDYVLREDQAPVGYVVIEQTKPITIDSNAVQVTVENKRNIQGVQLQKIDADTSEKLEGAVFSLQKKDGTAFNEISQHTTNKHGLITISELEAGHYQFVELKAPEGYELDETPIPFVITADQSKTIILEKENERIRGSIEIIKVDQDDRTIALAGVKFDLLDAAGNVIRKDLTTDSDGKLRIEHLQPRDYQLIETEAAEHYELLTEPISFTITDRQQVPLEMVVENKMIPGDVELTKVSAHNRDRFLRGAIFDLQDRDGKVLLTGLATNEEGKLHITDLRPGDYQFVETKAPARYRIDRTPYEFTIVPSQLETLEITFENAAIPFTPIPLDPPNPELPDSEIPDPEVPDSEIPDLETPDPEEPVRETTETVIETPKQIDSTEPTTVSHEPQPESVLDAVDPGESQDQEALGTTEASDRSEIPVTNESEPLPELETLPQTGEENLLYMMLVGIVFLLAGSSMLIYRKLKR